MASINDWWGRPKKQKLSRSFGPREGSADWRPDYVPYNPSFWANHEEGLLICAGVQPLALILALGFGSGLLFAGPVLVLLLVGLISSWLLPLTWYLRHRRMRRIMRGELEIAALALPEDALLDLDEDALIEQPTFQKLYLGKVIACLLFVLTLPPLIFLPIERVSDGLAAVRVFGGILSILWPMALVSPLFWYWRHRRQRAAYTKPQPDELEETFS